MKLLWVISISMDFISSLILSFGIITPEKVKSLGLKVATLVSKKPKNEILQLAYLKTFNDKNSADTEKCIVEFTVSLITTYISYIVLIIILVIVSVLLYSNYIETKNIFVLCLSLASFFVSFSLISEIIEPNKKIKNIIIKIFEIIGFLHWIAYPILKLIEFIISIFIIHLPHLWYKGLKQVSNRGSEWMFIAIGMSLIFINAIFKIILVLIG